MSVDIDLPYSPSFGTAMPACRSWPTSSSTAAVSRPSYPLSRPSCFAALAAIRALVRGRLPACVVWMRSSLRSTRWSVPSVPGPSGLDEPRQQQADQQEAEQDAVRDERQEGAVRQVAQQEGDHSQSDEKRDDRRGEGLQRREQLRGAGGADGRRLRGVRRAGVLDRLVELVEPGSPDGRDREQERVARRGGPGVAEQQAGGDRAARAGDPGHEGE